MDLFNDYITPAELTGYARAALADRPENQFLLSSILPDQPIDDLTYRFNQNVGGLIEAAEFRAYDAEPKFARRAGIARKTGELPPIARQMLLNEYDQLRQRKQPAAVTDAIKKDSVLLVRGIDARLEIARADALFNAAVTINEDGGQASVTFGRNPAHSVTAGTVWSDHANATPLDDIETWLNVYLTTNGQLPGRIIAPRAIVQALIRSTQIRTQLYPQNAGRRLTKDDVNQVLDDHDLPPITTYDAKVMQNGVERRVTPSDKMLFLPATSEGMGATLYGTTLESQEPEYGIEESEHPGIVVAALKNKTTPVQIITVASAIALPILGNPDLTFVADVL